MSKMSNLQKAILILSLISIAFVGLVFKRYYEWVSNTIKPFDEVGISLHKYMPAPIQAWGCTKLKATFQYKSLPPHYCGDPKNPGKWPESYPAN
jgi:hypothetical protein